MTKGKSQTGPVRLQDLHDEGRLLMLWCDCGHSVELAAGKVGLPLSTPIPGIANMLRCSKCNRRNHDTYHPISAQMDTRIPGVTGTYPAHR